MSPLVLVLILLGIMVILGVSLIISVGARMRAAIISSRRAKRASNL